MFIMNKFAHFKLCYIKHLDLDKYMNLQRVVNFI